MASTVTDSSIRSFRLAWGGAVLLLIIGEAVRWANPQQRADALTGWLAGPEADALPFLPVFLLGIRLLFDRWGDCGASDLPLERGDGWVSILLGGLGFAVAAWAGWDDLNRPPVFHDEYSYLFQAETFRSGRTWFPSFEPLPELFDQMHVLNEGRFASRYFPGAGAWFALFLGPCPIVGQWLAQGIIVAGMSIVAGELGGRTARLAAGLAAAGCPGLVLFSQLLLAHHPTLVGLTLLLVEFLRLYRLVRTGQAASRRARWAAGLAGCGLAYSMLCRPMTAAGVGLPFGIWLFRNWIQGHRTEPQRAVRWEHLGLIGLPLVAGIGLQLVYNQSITGDARISPYQQYTDIYTPRHVFGFHNVARGEQHLGPKVRDHYDRWAENLTLPLALRKMGLRVISSGRWTFGLIPLTFLVLWIVARWRSLPEGVGLIVASVVSLHLVHFPYWFEGILGWHYVFESAPLLAVLIGVVTADLFRISHEARRPLLKWWWCGVLLMLCLSSWTTFPPIWRGRFPVGRAELNFTREKYERFNEWLRDAISEPAIVFIQSDPADRHFDLVINSPSLDAPLLRAHAPLRMGPEWPDPESALHQAAALFPNRSVWFYDAATHELRLLKPAVEP
ncbi:MAG: hypothetical protein DWH91_17645 [Planctomycetota bacterium]|nr:MAG: hypothetical protein DWH91_17645 [Planctomycetota bacterium]